MSDLRWEAEARVQHKLSPAAMFTVIYRAMISGIQFSSQGCPDSAFWALIGKHGWCSTWPQEAKSRMESNSAVADAVARRHLFQFTGITWADSKVPRTKRPECKIGKSKKRQKTHRVHFMTRCLPARVISIRYITRQKYCWSTAEILLGKIRQISQRVLSLFIHSCNLSKNGLSK